MLDNPLTYFIFGLLFAWIGSYFYSAWHNRRKLTWLAKWLEPSLHILGSKISSRWHGTDRLDILIGEGRGMMRDGAIVLGVQSRRLFNALISTLRGGRDNMNILVSLQNMPASAYQFEVFGAKEPVPRTVALNMAAWDIEDYSRAPYRVAFQDETGRDNAFRLITLLLDLGLDIRRVSVRPVLPQLFFTFNMGRLPQSEAGELLRIVRGVAEEASQPAKTNLRPPRSGNKSSKTSKKEIDKLNRQFPPAMTQPVNDPKLSRNGHHKEE